jgi:hypothetical protein
VLPHPDAQAPPPLPAWQLFVGRRRELDEIDAVVAGLRGGRGRVVLITGEAGIGKTRLAEETGRGAAAAGARAVWGQCWESGGAPAYWPWSQVLRRLEAAAGVATWRTWIAGLERALAPLTAEPAPAAPPSDAESARFAAFDAVARLLRRAAAAQPLLVVLEDLHTADLPSLQLLALVAHELDDLPMVIIGTYRSGETEQRPAVALALGQLARSALRLPLAGLTVGEVGALLTADAPCEAPAEVVAAVHGATAGNPLFVVETARALHVAHPDGRVELAQGMLTSGVREAVRSRLDLLTPACRALLELAAVFGDHADPPSLQLASGASLPAVLDSVREGVAAGVLAGAAAAEGRIAFRHALLREVIYQDLAPARRRDLHRAAGGALAQRHGGDPGPHLSVLAHHFREGADDVAALVYTVQAARRAAALCADEQAVVAYRQALDLLAQRAPTDTPRRGQLLVELGEALTRLGEHLDARDVLRLAAADARQRADAALLGRVALACAERGTGVPHRVVDTAVIALCEESLAALPPADSALRVRLEARAAAERVVGDDPASAGVAGAAAVAMARRVGDADALAHALSAYYFVLWRLEQPADRLAVASEVVALGLATGNDDLVAQGRTWRLFDHMRSGDPLRVDEEIAAITELAQRLRRPRYRWIATNAQVMRALWQGRFAEAETGIAAALRQVERIGDPTARLNPSIQLFALRREQHRFEEQEGPLRMTAARFPTSPVPHTFLALLCAAEGRLDEARAVFAIVAAHDFEDLRREQRLGVLPYLSEVCAALGDRPRAAILYDLLTPHADTVVPYASSLCFGVGAHWLAMLAAVMGRDDDARAHAERAVARHTAMAAPPWLARSQVQLAELLARAGESNRAGALAAAARETAQALGMAGLAARASALLATSHRHRSVAARPRGVFRRDATGWLIGDGEQPALRLRPCKGFRYMAVLLRQPGRAMRAIDLAALDADIARTAAGPQPLGGGTHADLMALRDQLEEATRFNDPARAAPLRAELERRAALLLPGGRRRPGSTAAERARLNVTRTLLDAVRRIAAADPRLGRHFETTIHTGALCSYVPDPRLPIDWQL